MLERVRLEDAARPGVCCCPGCGRVFAGRADKPLRFRRRLTALIYPAPLHLKVAFACSGRPVAPKLPGDTGSGGEFRITPPVIGLV